MERVEAPTTATLEAIADAFNRHDVDAIMAFFAEDAVFEAPAGRDVPRRAGGAQGLVLEIVSA